MVDTTALNALAPALGLGQHEHIAIVGGGGKTTVLHALGRQLAGIRVLTCTTKMGHDQHGGHRVLLSPSDAEISALGADAPVMVWGRVDGQKAVGVGPQDCDRWFELVDHVIIEADGSRRRPFKAPAGYEPVVPTTTTLMLSVIGADALGKVIADRCHRPLRIAALAECSAYERLTPQAAATVLLHDRGARKELPTGSAFAVLVTKVDPASEPFVSQLLDELERRSPGTVVLAVADSAQGFGQGPP